MGIIDGEWDFFNVVLYGVTVLFIIVGTLIAKGVLFG